MIFLPKTRIPIVRIGAGINWWPQRYFTICDKNIVTLNLPHLNIRNKKYPLKDLLIDAIQFSKDSLLETYSNSCASIPIKLKSGIITSIEINNIRKKLGLTSDYMPFATTLPTAIMGNISKNQHIFPNIFHFENDLILIGAYSHQNNPANTEFDTILDIFFYKKINELWHDVLYKSLYEFSNRNYNIALVLLFSSLDIYTSSFFPKRSERPPKIIIRLQKLGFKRSFIKKFSKKIVTLRNNFEHEHEMPTQEQLMEAYLYAFHICWKQIKTKENK